MLSYFDLFMAYLFLCTIVACTMGIYVVSLYKNTEEYRNTFGDSNIIVAIFFSMVTSAIMWPIILIASVVSSFIRFIKR